MKLRACLIVACGMAFGCSEEARQGVELDPRGRGPYPVGSTNIEVAPEFADIDNDAMHNLLLGRAERPDGKHFLAEVLKHPESAWVVDVAVPEEPDVYGPASGMSLPVVTFLTYPSNNGEEASSYVFPYNDSAFVFDDMLAAGEKPRFADPDARYPLVVLAHGASSHGIYDVLHAHNLASHGYIVAVITYGDDRTAIPDDPNLHVGFLRPLMTKAVVDSLLASETFGPHIDAENIGIGGHSYGGFTALAVAGGLHLGNEATVRDERIKAAVIAAPWVGGRFGLSKHYAFGPGNRDLDRVTIPIISFFGTNDDVTTASFILPAMEKLSGPIYVIEMVDQPHIFEAGSWQDRDAWELLFFDAYLKQDPAALEALQTGRSMKGGNEDIQRFEYQRLPASSD